MAAGHAPFFYRNKICKSFLHGKLYKLPGRAYRTIKMWYWLLTFCIMGICIAKGIFIGIPLSFVLVLFAVIGVRQGTPFSRIKSEILGGARTSLTILWMLLLISINTAVWLSSGCVATLIRYGFYLLRPEIFLPVTFLLCAGVSYLIGSAFASTSTIGIVLYMIGCSGGIPAAVIAGTIISGVYFGDRASPISSPLLILSRLSDVPHDQAVRIAGKTALVPLLLTTLAFGGLSLLFPLRGDHSGIEDELCASFDTDLLSVLPAAVLLGLCLLRAGMTRSLLASSLTAVLLSVFHQSMSLQDVLMSILKGFTLPETDPLFTVIKGGGIIPMLPSIYIVFISCAFAAMFQNGSFLPGAVTRFLDKKNDRFDLNWRGGVLGLISSAIGCNQTMATVTTIEIMRPRYEKGGFSKEEMFTDVSFGSILVATLPPWSLAVSLPLTALQFEGYSYMPFLFFIYISVLYHVLKCRKKTD